MGIVKDMGVPIVASSRLQVWGQGLHRNANTVCRKHVNMLKVIPVRVY